MTSLLDNEEFKIFLASKRGLYQPIPIEGFYNPLAVRADGCVLRWNAISRVLPMDKSQRILDIGCSIGYFGFVSVEAGHVVDGFDTDKEAIFWSNRIIEEFGIPNINLWESSNDLLQNLREIPDDTYDYVFYFSVHHHICSRLGIEKANEVLQEISRIAPNMIFDMGQSNEVDNGWLTWLRKIPQFENHRIELPEWVLKNSAFNYADCIGHSPSHEIDRLLFLFIRNVPTGTDYSKKIISIRNPDSGVVRGFNVKEYIWKERGGRGKIQHSPTSFPIMDLRSSMASRFYLATDLGGTHYFIKEYLTSWLSPNKNYKTAQATYERGKALEKIPRVSHRVVSPLTRDGNMVVYPYYNWPTLTVLTVEDLTHDFFDELLEVVGLIYQEIGVFDLNPNNILYNIETGDFKLIDFEPASSSNFTFRVFHTRIMNLYTIFERVFNYEDRSRVSIKAAKGEQNDN